MHRLIAFALLAIVAIPSTQAAPGDSLDLRKRIERLGRMGSVMMIAAHPDDENTAVLAYFAQGRKFRTAYLSLTRGEGGQNLIGAEQGAQMGLIRTQELLAARRIDGARQFFSRAIDFGFSKTAEETLAKWGRDEILGDAVLAIRRFRPDIVLLRFSGTPRDGHGHHQSSAILGKEAFAAAADPNRFPEHAKAGLAPWKARRLYWNVFSFNRAMEQQAASMKGNLQIDVGEFDPTLGMSYGEIAGLSRSQHRSQGMGAPQRKGPQLNYLNPLAGDPAVNDPFDGIDTTWNRVPGGAAVSPVLERALREFRLDNPAACLPALVEARRLIAAIDDPLAREKLSDLDELIADSAGVWLDASAERPVTSPGATLGIRFTAINRSHAAVSLKAVTVDDVAASQANLGPLEFNKPNTWTDKAAIPSGAAYTQPYWLREPPSETRYRIADPSLIGLPETAAALMARFRLEIAGEPIELTRAVQHRYVDRERGELIRPLEIAPSVAVAFAGSTMLFPSVAARKVEVELRANGAGQSGDIALHAPAGWKIEPASQAFRIASAGEMATVAFMVTPPVAATRAQLEAVARVAGREIRHGMHTIEYDHIPPQTIYPLAAVPIVRADAKVLSHRIGYVMGAGDEVPQALRQLGVEVVILSADDLARADLSHYDAIVTGVRAYNVRDDLRANQQRLLDYASGGGTLIVQYNVAEGGGPFGGGDPTRLAKIGPYPLKVSRDRVTVEDAPLKPVSMDHPLLMAPNRITDADYAGWVQERGLYFASEFDEHYQPVWESNDPGEKPSRGGTLYTRYGKGVYIFTPMAWFRQLPAGVPGAYRIFANFLSAGKMK
ncbi:MAG: PIG-L family deacetylase [Bryobacteraceae bacterium]